MQITNDVGGKCNEVGTKMNDCATNFFWQSHKNGLSHKRNSLIHLCFRHVHYKMWQSQNIFSHSQHRKWQGEKKNMNKYISLTTLAAVEMTKAQKKCHSHFICGLVIWKDVVDICKCGIVMKKWRTVTHRDMTVPHHNMTKPQIEVHKTCLKRVTLLMGYKKWQRHFICAMFRKKTVFVVLKNAIVVKKCGKDIRK